MAGFMGGKQLGFGDYEQSTAKKRTKRIGFEVLIETALGMANVEAIAQSSKRLEAMSFGVADYAASTRARTSASARA